MLNCGCRDPCWAREGREGVWWALSGGFPGVYSLGGAVSGRPKSLEAIPKVPKKLPIKTLARSFGGGGAAGTLLALVVLALALLLVPPGACRPCHYAAKLCAVGGECACPAPE